jgi:hypothetical protein
MRSSVAVSSPERALWLALAVLTGCATGPGEGEVAGPLTALSCDLDNVSYSLDPSFFSATDVEDQLEIRLQRTGAMPDQTDGLSVIVHDVPEVQSTLGTPISIALTGAEALVQLTLVLSDSCPVRRASGTPVFMSAVEGEIVFQAIHSPEHPGTDKRIAASFDGVRFVDPGSPDETFAVLSGYFDFLYSRGRPLQLFP